MRGSRVFLLSLALVLGVAVPGRAHGQLIFRFDKKLWLELARKIRTGKAGTGKVALPGTLQKEADQKSTTMDPNRNRLPDPNDPRNKKKKEGQTWLQDNVFDRVRVTGQRTLGYHSFNVQGDREAYNALTNFGTGLQQFTDIGSLQVTGAQVLGVLNFDFRFNDNRFQDPQNQQYTLRYQNAEYDLAYGTIQATLLNSNQLIGFSRSVEGFVGGWNDGNFSARVLTTQARGSARTVVIEGNNSAGPYYLQGGRVIDGTLRLQVDGQALSLGRDFILDAELGTITFLDRVIAPTSSITVTYESFGFGQNSGRIEGASLGYNFGSAGQIGFTTIRQVTGATGTAQDRLEQFQGFGSPSTPYFLQFEPIAGSVEIRVDGIIQVQGVAGTNVGDYFFDPQNPLIFYFRRFIPSTSTVIVRYRPRLTQTVDGDREVTGWDYRIPLGVSKSTDGTASTNRGYLQYSTAQGRLKSATPLSGTARSVDSRYELGNYTIKAGWREIPNDFVSVESTGFARNERSVQSGVEYRAGRYQGEFAYNNAVIDTSNPLDPSQSFTSTRAVNMTGSMNFRNINGGLWSATHSRMRLRNTESTRLDTSTVSYSKSYGRLSQSYGVESQIGRGRVGDQTSTKIADIGVDTFRASYTYDAGQGLSASIRASQSNVKVDTDQGQGFDTFFSVGYRGDSPWAVSASYIVSDSGAVASLGGFLNSAGLGFGGNGFSGGSGQGTLSVGATALRRVGLEVERRINAKWTVQAVASQQTATGLSTSNTQLQNFRLSSDYAFDDSHRFYVSLDRSFVTFVSGIVQKTSATTLTGFFEGRPEGPWSYRVGYSSLISEGGNFAQDSLGIDFDIGYRLDSKQRLNLSRVSNEVRGYYPQNDSALSFGYSYTIYKNLALTGRYNIRDLRNLDPTQSAGAFRANTFDLELTFDFGK